MHMPLRKYLPLPLLKISLFLFSTGCLMSNCIQRQRPINFRYFCFFDVRHAWRYPVKITQFVGCPSIGCCPKPQEEIRRETRRESSSIRSRAVSNSHFKAKYFEMHVVVRRQPQRTPSFTIVHLIVFLFIS